LNILFFQKQSHISEHIGCNFTKEGSLAIVLETSEEYASKLLSLWYVRKLYFKIWINKNIIFIYFCINVNSMCWLTSNHIRFFRDPKDGGLGAFKSYALKKMFNELNYINNLKDRWQYIFESELCALKKMNHELDHMNNLESNRWQHFFRN